MTNPRRRAEVALALCGTVALAGWIVASLAGPGSTRIEHAGAAVPTAAMPIEDHHTPSLSGEVVDAPRATALGNINVVSAWAWPPIPADAQLTFIACEHVYRD